MERLLNVQTQPLTELSPLTLAFVGDGVYELFVRQYIVSLGNCPVKKLHGKSVKMVCCGAQHKALSEKLWPLLTEEEKAMALRGRNAHVGHVPKNASVEEYHGATALETLFGWLYLRGETSRLQELFAAVVSEERR